jgi:hypothetical protein
LRLSRVGGRKTIGKRCALRRWLNGRVAGKACPADSQYAGLPAKIVFTRLVKAWCSARYCFFDGFVVSSAVNRDRLLQRLLTEKVILSVSCATLLF